ncbi:MAG: radical SAM protein [Myxococcales bacterium]|nr:radical SAM protein [Myxococcales bacterium]
MPLSGLRRDLGFARSVATGRPFNVLLQVTNRCNMTCSFCDFWPNGARPEDELTVEDFARLSDGLAERGRVLFSIEGGEPTGRPDLPDIVRVLARHHLTALFTNGWRMTPDLARSLWDAGLTHASVSIDYATAARHDEARGVQGASERAWRALELLRDSSPAGDRRVHVMTVVMHDNVEELPALLERTAALGVGHQLTLLSVDGDRRGGEGTKRPPPEGTGALLLDLWRRHGHLRFLREYFERMDDFLGGRAMPRCNAGSAGFNVDHLGELSPCIERIGEPVGNLRRDPLPVLLERLAARRDELASCQRCWTACRGFQQALSSPTLRTWQDLALRTRA